MRRAWLLVVAALALAPAAARADDPPGTTPARADVPPPDAERVTLAAAVQRALARNPTVAVAEAEVRRAQALVEQVRASSLPALSAGGVLTRLDSDRVRNGQVILPANQQSANAVLTVPLVMPQRWAQWWHASDNRRTAEVQAAETRRQVAAAVARTYLAVVSQHRTIEVLLRARDTARAHYDFAHARFVGGVGNHIDEVRAGQEMATTEAQLQNALAGLTRTREALGVLVGAEGAVDSAGEATLAGTPEEPAALAGVRDRSDIRLGQARQRATEHLVRDNWTDYSPYLTATAQAFFQNPSTFTSPQTGWQAQLILTIPLYDGGLRYGLAHERQVLADEARINVEAALRQARSEVRTAFEALRRADQALLAARDAGRLAEEALALANTAYRAGAVTNLEVIDAERRARDAATVVAQAEDAARQARLDLLIASGRWP